MLPIKLAANGSVAAWQEASVGAEANGLRVAELHANVGDTRASAARCWPPLPPRACRPMWRWPAPPWPKPRPMRPRPLANADRARAVQGTGAISAQQVNQYLTQEQTAKARVESAKAQLDRATAAPETHPAAGTRQRHHLVPHRHAWAPWWARAPKCSS